MLVGHLHFPLRVAPRKAQAAFKQGLLTVKVTVKKKRGPHVSAKIK